MTCRAWDDLAGRLYGVLIAVGDRLGSDRAGEAHHYIEVGEYGLALDEILVCSAWSRPPLPTRDRGPAIAADFMA